MGLKREPEIQPAVEEFGAVLARIAKWPEKASDALLAEVLEAITTDNVAGRILVTAQARTRLISRMRQTIEDPVDFGRALEIFRPIHELFVESTDGRPPKQRLEWVLDDLLDLSQDPRPLVILDLTEPENRLGYLLDRVEVKAEILKTISDQITQRGQAIYSAGSGSLNILVVFDEAKQFASKSTENTTNNIGAVGRLSKKLVTNVLETRKLGIGWMFVSQEATSINPEIFRLLRIKAFGYGLIQGPERRVVEDAVGPEAFKLYSTFVDPESFRDQRFSFMITGQVSPMAFSGNPVFVDTFTDFNDYRSANELKSNTVIPW